jgi:predicted DNA-binding protein with PD1-like motif
VNEIVFRLRRGEDLLLGIRAAAEKHGLSAAYVGCCVGCVLRARVRDAGGISIREIEENMEIVSLTGTVSRERCHLHVSFSKEDLSTVGGHLVEGCVVNTTAEIVLCPLSQYRFGSVWDEETGYPELEVEAVGKEP